MESVLLETEGKLDLHREECQTLVISIQIKTPQPHNLIGPNSTVLIGQNRDTLIGQ